MNGYEQMAAMIKALAHPARLQILRVLSREEACVCHLEAVLGLRQANISQQLMKLREAGLVIDRRDGMNVFYALADAMIVDVLDSLQHNLTTFSDEPVEFTPLPGGPEAGCPCPQCVTSVGDTHSVRQAARYLLRSK